MELSNNCKSYFNLLNTHDSLGNTTAYKTQATAQLLLTRILILHNNFARPSLHVICDLYLLERLWRSGTSFIALGHQ